MGGEAEKSSERDNENEKSQSIDNENGESEVAEPEKAGNSGNMEQETETEEGNNSQIEVLIEPLDCIENREPVESVENRPAAGIPVTFGISVTEAVREIRFRIEQRTKLTASAGKLLHYGFNPTCGGLLCIGDRLMGRLSLQNVHL